MLALVVSAVLQGRYTTNLEQASATKNSSSFHFDTLVVSVVAVLTLCSTVMLGGLCCCRLRRKKNVNTANVTSKKNPGEAIEMSVRRVHSNDVTTEVMREAGTHQREPVTVKLVTDSSTATSCGLGFNVYGDRATGAIFVCEVLRSGPAKLSGKIHPGDRLMSLKVSTACMEIEDALTILSYASPYPVELCLQPANDSFRSSFELGRQRAATSARSSRLQTVRRAHSASGSRSTSSAEVAASETIIGAEKKAASERLRKPLERSQSEVAGGHRRRTQRDAVHLYSSEGMAVLVRTQSQSRSSDELERDGQAIDDQRMRQTPDSRIVLETQSTSHRPIRFPVDYTICSLHAAPARYGSDKGGNQLAVERRIDDDDDGCFDITDADGAIHRDSKGIQVRNPTELRRSAVGRKPIYLTSSDNIASTTTNLRRERDRTEFNANGVDVVTLQNGRQVSERRWSPHPAYDLIVNGASGLESRRARLVDTGIHQTVACDAVGIHRTTGRNQVPVAESVGDKSHATTGFVRSLPKLNTRGGQLADSVSVLPSGGRNVGNRGLNDEQKADGESTTSNGVVNSSFFDIDLNDDRSNYSDAPQCKPEVLQPSTTLPSDRKKKVHKSVSADLISKFRNLLSPGRVDTPQKFPPRQVTVSHVEIPDTGDILIGVPTQPELGYVAASSKDNSKGASFNEMARNKTDSAEAVVRVPREPSSSDELVSVPNYTRFNTSRPGGLRSSTGNMPSVVDSNNNDVTTSISLPFDYVAFRTSPKNSGRNPADVDSVAAADAPKSDAPILGINNNGNP